MFAQGISKTGELIDLGVEKKVVEKSGAWYSYQGERLGQGRDAVRDFLLSNQPLAREIEGKLRDLAGLPGRTPERSVEAPMKDEKKTEEKREERRPHKVGA
jgi:recombination protein RecA